MTEYEQPQINTQKLALVTGAAHRIGRAVALELAQHGFSIGLHYHQSIEKARVTQKQIEQTGAAVILLQADLRDPNQIDGLFSKVKESGFQLHVLVNSAAVMPALPLADLKVEQWDDTLALNLRAPWLCAVAAARLMDREGGIIINVTDAGDQRAWTKYPAYTVSKAGLESLTRLLARSLAPSIRVNAVAPGLILPSESVQGDEWQRLVNRLPLKRSGTPEEVARVVSFLIDHPYITGQTIVVDGGYQLT